MRIAEADIVKIRQAANIVEIIGQHLTLHKAGRNYSALCPFHNDTNPSLMISSDKQIYKCFVCGAGGNVFTFLQAYQQISFPEAVKVVADHVGIPLDISQYTYEKDYSAETLRLFEVLTAAIEFTTYQLNQPAHQSIQAYLLNRNISKRALKKFNVGFDPQHELSKFLLKKGFSQSELIAVNLLNLTANQDYDIFSNRIVFPIYNEHNQPVGFSGRVTIEGQQPKYLNTAETAIFKKGQLLYNYPLAKTTIRQTQTVYLVEGVLDVIAFDEAGVYNCVATLGTAFTNEQARLLKRLGAKVILAYDGDSAGQLAAFKTGQLLLAQGLTVSVFNGFKTLDADEYLSQVGVEKFNETLRLTKTWIEFLMEYYLDKYDLANYESKKSYVQVLIEAIKKESSSFDQAHYLADLARVTGFKESALADLLAKKTVTKLKTPANQVTQITSSRLAKEFRTEFEIINQLLLAKEAYLLFQAHLGHLIHPEASNLVLLIGEYYLKYDRLELADLLSDLDNDTSKELLLIISELETLPKVYNKAMLFEAINRIKIQMLDQQIAHLKKQLVADVSSAQTVMAKIQALNQQKNQIIKGEDI